MWHFLEYSNNSQLTVQPSSPRYKQKLITLFNYLISFEAHNKLNIMLLNEENRRFV